MFDFPFAYTDQMQLILAFTSFLMSFVEMYYISELILILCDVKASPSQKAVFAIITGCISNTGLSYLIYYLGGKQSFTDLLYLIICTPNPIFAFVYYYVAQKIFNLSQTRSLGVISYIYIYWVLEKLLFHRLLQSMFFPQIYPKFNYLTNTIQQIVGLIVFMIVTSIIKKYIITNQASIRFIDSGFINKYREFVLYLIKTSFIYILIVIIPTLITNDIIGNSLVILFYVIFMMCCIFYDMYIYDYYSVSNQAIHIKNLSKGMEDFRAVKHDFYNILHTYSGYLEMKLYPELNKYHLSLVNETTKAGDNLDLISQMSKNPSLVSLLMEKSEYASRNDIDLSITLKCDVENFYINSLDFTRVMTCLLNNAIEAAEETEDKKVTFSCETKDDNTKLIIISNTTKNEVDINKIQKLGITSKHEHSGIGLYTVKKTLSKYGNCRYQLNYFNNQFSAYIEFKPNV